MKIAFVYTRGRLRRLNSVQAGESASEFFFGSEQLRAAGHEIDMIEVGMDESGGIVRRLTDILFGWGLLPNRTRGWVFWGLRPQLTKLNESEVVVSTTTGTAFSLGIWKALGKLRPEIVAIHCGIFNYPPNWLRRLQIRYLLNRMWTMIYGAGEYEPMRQTFDTPAERLVVNQFGVDCNFWSPGGHESDFILSVGNDSRRDYGLLVRAAATLGCKTRIVTRLEVPGPIPTNVEILNSSWHKEALTDLELRELYRQCLCVVVPLRESFQPSGQSVALQAMACGKPVVMTHTRGLWSPERIRDDENLLLVPPGDEVRLTAAISSVLRDPGLRQRLGQSARRTVCEHFTIRHFADGMATVCRAAAARQTGTGEQSE